MAGNEYYMGLLSLSFFPALSLHGVLILSAPTNVSSTLSLLPPDSHTHTCTSNYTLYPSKAPSPPSLPSMPYLAP